MSDIILKHFHHLTLVFWRIGVEVFYERKKVGIGCAGDLLVLDEFEDMIITLELFLSTVYSRLYSFLILLVGFIIHSGVSHVGCWVFFLESHLET